MRENDMFLTSEIRNIEKEIICCIVDHDELAYICEKIILEQLKNNFRTRSLWPCHTKGG